MGIYTAAGSMRKVSQLMTGRARRLIWWSDAGDALEQMHCSQKMTLCPQAILHQNT